jgi:hypothetical protein
MTRASYAFPVLSSAINTLNKWTVGLNDLNTRVQTIEDTTVEAAQDAIGTMVDSTLIYTDATPLLQRAALTGDVTAPVGSNATTIANDAVTFAKIQNVASGTLAGRTSASTGDLESITVNNGLTLGGLVLSAPLDGWLFLAQSGTYVSASSFTVTGDFTSTIQKGDKLKFTNSSQKYGHVASVTYSAPNSTITIYVNTDYVLTNTTITNIYFGKGANAVGFPSAFSFASTPTQFSVVPSGALYQYAIEGGRGYVDWRQPNQGTSNGTGFSIPIPITAMTLTGMSWGNNCWTAVNAGANLNTAQAFISSGTASISLITDAGFTGWGALLGKSASGSLNFPI